MIFDYCRFFNDQNSVCVVSNLNSEKHYQPHLELNIPQCGSAVLLLPNPQFDIHPKLPCRLDVSLPLGSTLAPGFAVWQATQETSASLFCTRHTSHSQEPEGFFTISPNPSSGALLVEEGVPAEAPVKGVTNNQNVIKNEEKNKVK